MKEFIKDLFTWKWRWNRLKFWIYPLIWLIIFLPILWISVYFSILGSEILSNLLYIWILFLYAVMIYISVVANIKRLHDLDKSGWFAFIILIPFVSIGLLIYCGFFSWTKWENRFGPDPLNRKKEEEVKVEL